MTKLSLSDQLFESDAGMTTDVVETPTLEQRALVYLRAVHGARDFSAEELSQARSTLLDSMADDIVGKLSDEAAANPEVPFDDRLAALAAAQNNPQAMASMDYGDALFAAYDPPSRSSDHVMPDRAYVRAAKCSQPLSKPTGVAPSRRHRSGESRRFILTFTSLAAAATVALVVVAIPSYRSEPPPSIEIAASSEAVADAAMLNQIAQVPRRPLNAPAMVNNQISRDDTRAAVERLLANMGATAPRAAPPISVANWVPKDDEIESYQLDGLSGPRIKTALQKRYADRGTLVTRGPRDAELYRKSASAVVIVVTDEGIGSGVHIGADQILTNWHVVGTHSSVGVVFKPALEGAAVAASSVVRANVVKVDVQKDLALLKVAFLPEGSRALELGSPAEIQVGADVHAIGHPTGEAWTYTKGLISQVRRGYEWSAETRKHRANVIQTQTPINPGNSGGPLIADSGKLIGINSFRTSNAEGINFAVSVEDVLSFLDSQTFTSRSQQAACKPIELYRGRTQRGDGETLMFDTNCDGRPDLVFTKFDDATKPIEATLDSNFDGKIDIVVNDTDRDGRWDISFHDVDFDGTVDLVGYHPDGKLKPSRYEQYVANRK